MCQNKTKEEMRDQAIGMLEEARDGLDAVLSELEYGEELADSDSRIRRAVDLITKTAGIVDDLRTESDESEDKILKRFLNNAYERISLVSEPISLEEINCTIRDLNQAMLYLKACNFPIKI